MKALVTGATGLIGSRLVRHLVREGFHVRALARDPGRCGTLHSLQTEICQGDLTDRRSLEKAVLDCDVLFHLAADYRLWVPDPETMHRVNVEGTRHLMQAAVKAGVKRVVFTSSVATLGLPKPGATADEETPSSLKDMVGPYKRTKFLAEEAVKRMVREDGLPAVIVNPSAPIGPGDARPTPTGAMVLQAANKSARIFTHTGMNVVHVDDVANGHILALRKGEPGERYILGGENTTLRDIFANVAHLVGRPGPVLRLPRCLLMPMGTVAESFARMGVVRNPSLTRDSARMAGKMMHFTSRKARERLGYTHRPAAEALRDAVAWFRERGMIR